MAKFLIFALLAHSVCSSSWLGFPKLSKEEVQLHLKQYFELTPDDLKKECNVDFQTAWQKIGAALNKLSEQDLNIVPELPNHVNSGNDIMDELQKRISATCWKSEPYKNAVIHVIKTALPCAEKPSLDKHFETSKPNIC